MSSTATPHLRPEEVFGIAKKMYLELEKYNINDHSAIISMEHAMCVHRENRMKMDMQQAQIDAQEAAMDAARKAHAEAQVLREAKIAGEIRKVVEEPASQAMGGMRDNPKPPRLSIVLDRPSPDAHLGASEQGQPSAADLDADAAEKQAAAQTAAPAEVLQ
jgi:hypothetical protein